MSHRTTDAPAPAPASSDSGPTKRLFIKTYGCQMNVYDSERMRDVLTPLGYEPVETPDSADLIILNTCHIREKAAEKVYSELGRLRELKEAREEAGGRMMIAVAGCVAQAEGEEMMRRAPFVDLVLGPQTYHKLPEMIAKAHRAVGERLAVDFDVVEKFDQLGGTRHADGPSAFVTVQEGCDKFCAFCVVPYTRGKEWSRPVDQIVEETRSLVRQGVREVTLLGQNVNAYAGAAPIGGVAGESGAGEKGASWGLANLVRHLAKIDRLDRIRFTTSHPRDMDDALIAAFGEEKKLMPYLHLPVQSGSDKILKAMNRRHTAQDYVDVIARVRAARPDIAISGDFIVAFPGETEEDFEATMEIVRTIGYASAYSFKYSRRPGTPAAELHMQVPADEASDRLTRLQALLDEQQRAFNQAQIGARLPVLFEKAGRKPGQLHGRSPYLQSVHVDGPDHLIGDIVEVEIGSATRGSLSGSLAGRRVEPALEAV